MEALVMRKRGLLVGALVVSVGVGFAAGWFAHRAPSPPGQRTVTVPNLNEMSLGQAVVALKGAGLELGSLTARRDLHGNGAVISQSLPPLSAAVPGQKVALVLSAGAHPLFAGNHRVRVGGTCDAIGDPPGCRGTVLEVRFVGS
jgi:PASTA domain